MPNPGSGYRMYVGGTILVLQLAVPLFSLILFWWRRKHHPIKRSGRPKVAFVLMYIACIYSSPGAIVEADGWDHMSCLVYKLSAMCYPPLFITPVLVSQIQHYRGARIHAKMAHHAASKSMKRREKGIFESLVSELKVERRNLRRNTVLMYIIILVLYGSTVTIFLMHNKISLQRFTHIDYKNIETCLVSKEIFAINIVYSILALLIIALIVYYNKRENLQDDFGIHREYLYVVIICATTIPIFSFLHEIPDPPLYIDSFDPSLCFTTSMVASYCVLVLWPAIRTFKQTNKRESTHRLSVEHTDLNEVLNSNLYFIFIEHLKLEFSVENCLFWKEVETLKHDFEGGNVDNTVVAVKVDKAKQDSFKARKQQLGIRTNSSGEGMGSSDRSSGADMVPLDVAMDIYDMFIKQGAPMEVNISSKTKERITAALQQDEGHMRDTLDGVNLGGELETVPLGVFDDAQAEVFRLMESDSLPRFKQGKLFKNYVEAMATHVNGPHAIATGGALGIEMAKRLGGGGCGHGGGNQGLAGESKGAHVVHRPHEPVKGKGGAEDGGGGMPRNIV